MSYPSHYRQGYAVSEGSAGDASSAPDEMSRCSGSVLNGQCMCSFVVTHFSTFAVAEADAATGPTSVSPNRSPSPAAAMLSCYSMILTFIFFVL